MKICLQFKHNNILHTNILIRAHLLHINKVFGIRDPSLHHQAPSSIFRLVLYNLNVVQLKNTITMGLFITQDLTADR